MMFPVSLSRTLQQPVAFRKCGLSSARKKSVIDPHDSSPQSRLNTLDLLAGFASRLSSECRDQMHVRHETSNPANARHSPPWHMVSTLRLLWLFAILVGTPTGYASDRTAVKTPAAVQAQEVQESPLVTQELINVVEAYIAAGEKNDPAARGKYLAPKVFYYGHALTRDQAVREIATLYRRWPERQFIPTDSIELFRIPKHRADYRVTALYEYKFDNLVEREHLSGMSELTFVVEHSAAGVRIIGVDEKLVNASTRYQRE